MRLMPFRILLLVLLLLPLTVNAQQDIIDFPTVQALAMAEIPHRDLLELAQRLEGLGDVAAPPLNPPTLPVGMVDTFWASNSNEDESFQVEAELKVVGKHIYLWVERDVDVSQDGLQRLADEFDKLVYDQVRDLWGSEPIPGIDGDVRVHGVFVHNLGMGVGAYFAGKHTYSAEAVPTSNQREMFFYNLDAVDYLIGSDALTTITAHEFQHMVRSNVDPNEYSWMDEGFSSFTEVYLGDTDAFSILSFLNTPNTQLNAWSEDGNRTADYGAAQLWITYLYERFGKDWLTKLSFEQSDGFVAIDKLTRHLDTDANTIFADWVVANWVLDPANSESGIFGYETYSGLTSPRHDVVNVLPYNQTLTVNQYASHYLAVTNLAGVESLNVLVDVSPIASRNSSSRLR